MLIDRILTEAISLFGRRRRSILTRTKVPHCLGCCRQRLQKWLGSGLPTHIHMRTSLRPMTDGGWGMEVVGRVSVRAKTFDCNSINKRDH